MCAHINIKKKEEEYECYCDSPECFLFHFHLARSFYSIALSIGDNHRIQRERPRAKKKNHRMTIEAAKAELHALV